MKKRLGRWSILILAATAFMNSGVNAQCASPVPSVLKIVNDSVSITWPSVPGVVGYEYLVQLASLPMPTSGTLTSFIVAGEGNLPYAAHKAWVRSDCGSGVFSSWADITFTIVCSKPGTITVPNVGYDTADISWTQIADITNYEYALDTVASDPAGNGIPVTGTTYAAKLLDSGTKYYMHVRTDCGSGTYSAWTTQDFTTLFPTGISGKSHSTGIRAYPNPVTDKLWIEIPGVGVQGKVSISNIAGVIVFASAVSDGKFSVDMQSFAPGIYILKYSDESGTAYTRVLKQ